MNSNKFFSRIIVALVMIFFLAIHIQAQEKKPIDEKTKHAVGAGAGFTTGYGLSYRFTPNKFGLQVNFAPFKNETTTRNSVGLTFLYSLLETEKTNLYLYQANHFYSNSELVDNATFTGKVRKNESYINNGFGFGVEIIIATKIGFNLMTGYAAYDNFNGYNLTGEAALYFKF